MFYGMHFRSVHDRLFIGAGHTQVKGGDYFRSHIILAGYINAGLQFDMVNGEAGYFFQFFHVSFPFRVFGTVRGSGRKTGCTYKAFRLLLY